MDMLQFHKSLGLEKQMRKIEFYYFEHNLEKKRKKEKIDESSINRFIHHPKLPLFFVHPIAPRQRNRGKI